MGPGFTIAYGALLSGIGFFGVGLANDLVGGTQGQGDGAAWLLFIAIALAKKEKFHFSFLTFSLYSLLTKLLMKNHFLTFSLTKSREKFLYVRPVKDLSS